MSGLVVNTNIQSLFAQRALSKNTDDLKTSMERLSTGFRINRAADDAAGLSISEKMTSEIKGLKKAKQNALDGISLLQTGEGALAIIQDNLQRIRELMVQTENGTNSTDELNAMQREINERVSAINDIAKATKFNGQDIIYNNPIATDDIVLQTGSESGQQTNIVFRSGTATANSGIDIDINSTANGTLGEGSIALNTLHVGGTVAAFDTVTVAKTGNLGHLDTMIKNVSRMRSYLGAVQNSLESKIEYMDVAIENVSSSRSRIKDVDVANESSELIKKQILQQSAAAMLGQANTAPQIALDLLP
jgi:flagellin